MNRQQTEKQGSCTTEETKNLHVLFRMVRQQEKTIHLVLLMASETCHGVEFMYPHLRLGALRVHEIDPKIIQASEE